MDIYYITNDPPKEDGEHAFDEGKIWFKDGKVHRDDGPAIEWNNGRNDWFVNGKRHREDGPALTFPTGRKEWFLNGKPHREDGPAVEDPQDNDEWFLHGQQYSRHTFPGNLTKSVESALPQMTDTQLRSISTVVSAMLQLRKAGKQHSIESHKKPKL